MNLTKLKNLILFAFLLFPLFSGFAGDPLIIKKVADLAVNAEKGQHVTDSIKIGDEIFLLVEFEDGAHRLFISDGTNSGTIPIDPDNLTKIDRDSFIELNGQLYFTVNDGAELWSSDGTLEGTTSESSQIEFEENFLVAAFAQGLRRFSIATGAEDPNWKVEGSTYGLSDFTFGPDLNSDGLGDIYRIDDFNKLGRYDRLSGTRLSDFPIDSTDLLADTYILSDVVIGPNGDLFLLNTVNTPLEGVYRFDADTGVFLNKWVDAPFEDAEDHRAFTFGPDGKLYIASTRKNRIIRLDPESEDPPEIFIDETLPVPVGFDGKNHDLAFGPDGHLYVVAKSTEILKFDGVTGEAMGRFTNVPQGELMALAFVSTTDIYALDLNDKIHRIDQTTGQYLGVLANTPTNLGNELALTNETMTTAAKITESVVLGDTLYLSVQSQVETGALQKLDESNGTLTTIARFDSPMRGLIAGNTKLYFTLKDGAEIWESDGTPEGTAQVKDLGALAELDNSIHFDGVDDFIEIPHSPSLDLTRSATIMFWIQSGEFSNSKSWHPIIYKGDGDQTNPITRTYSVFLNRTGYIHFSTADATNEFVDTPHGAVRQDQWTHYTVTVDRDNGELRAYINGIITASATVTTNDASSSQNPLIFGIDTEDHPTIEHFSGALDEVKIWDVVLTETEIRDQLFISGTGSSPAPVGYWNFEIPEDVNSNQQFFFNDQSGNTNHGQLKGGPQILPADVPFPESMDAIEFDGTDDLIDIGPLGGALPSSGVTLESWVFLNDLSNHGIIRKQLSFALSIANQQIVFASGTQWGPFPGTGSPPPVGQWFHVAAVWDGFVAKIYVNGVQSGSDLEFTDGPILDNTNSAHLGFDENGWFLNGRMDEVRIWNRARSQAEIQSTMMTVLNGDESGLVGYWKCNQIEDLGINADGIDDIQDSTANNHHGDLVGSPQLLSGRPIGGYMEFDGIDDYLVIPFNSSVDIANKSFSWEFWMKNLDTSLSNNWIISQGPGGSPNQGLHIDYRVAGTLMRFGFWNNDLDYSPPSPLTGWNHWAFTFDGPSGNRRIYLNGVVVAEDTATVFAGQSDIFIGKDNHPTADFYFRGQLDEVRLWDHSLSQTDIENRMNQRLVGDEAGLSVYLPMDEIDPTELTSGRFILDDLSPNQNDANSPSFIMSSAPEISIGPVVLPTMTTIGDDLYLARGRFNSPWELCKVTGSDGMVDVLGDFDSPPVSLTDFNGSLTFFAKNGDQLWASDGTQGGTTLIKDFKLETQGSIQGKHLDLDGMNGRISVSDNNTLDGMAQLTLEAWVYLNDLSNQGIIRKNFSYALSIFNGTLQYANGTQWSFTPGQTGFTPPTKRWFHVALTWNGSVARAYVNGQRVGPNLDFTNGSIPNNGNATRIGFDDNGWYLNGRIDEVRIWNTTRSQSDILSTMFSSLSGSESNLVGYWNFDDGTATDGSNNGNDGTIEGNAALIDDVTNGAGRSEHNFGAALHLGVNDARTDFGNPGAAPDYDFLILGDLTLETWIYPVATGTRIITYGGSGENLDTNIPYLINYTATGDISVTHEPTDWTQNQTVTFGANVPLNQWTHVAVIRKVQQKTYTLFLNGSQFSVPQTYALQPDATGTSGFLRIGASEANPPTIEFQGMIDEVRIWNVVRQPHEIRDYILNPLTGYEAGLVGNWRFDVDEFNKIDGVYDIRDYSLNQNHGHLLSGAIIAMSDRVPELPTVFSGGTELWFSAAGNRSLWLTDGTNSGTQLVSMVNQHGGGVGALPDQFGLYLDQLLFAGNNGIVGQEIWQSDRTDTGTNFIGEVYPGPAWSNPRAFYSLNEDLLFTAKPSLNTVELWRVSPFPAILLSRVGVGDVPGGTASGMMDNDQLGFSVSGVGDVNGDGIDDLIIGAPGGDGDDPPEAGESYLLSGNKSGLGTDGLIDLGQARRFVGAGSNDESGKTVSGIGDFNGDGATDFLVSSPPADRTEADQGEVHLVFGDMTLAAGSAIELGNLGGQGLKIIGLVHDIALTGASISGAGDVNGDGKDDLLVGVPGADGTGNVDRIGFTYLIFGADTFFEEINLGSLVPAEGLRIEGINANDEFGKYVSGAGDTNGDGFDDFLIGSSNSTSAFLIYGSKDALGTNGVLKLVDVDSSSGVELQGLSPAPDVAGGSGTRLAGVGDVNGDGFADIALGDPGADPKGKADAGQVFVVAGSAQGIGTNGLLDLNTIATNDDGFIINGVSPGDWLGFSVSGAGDFNGDGYADLVAGAPFGLEGAGEVYVLFGGPGGLVGEGNNGEDNVVELFTESLPEDQVGMARFISTVSGESSGWSVSGAGDVNKDGFSDVLIGAVGSHMGTVYVIHGGAQYGPPLAPEEGSRYLTFVRSGIEGFQQRIISPQGLGMIGDGSQSIPISRYEIGYLGGGFGSGLQGPSRETVTLYRQPIPQPTDIRLNPGGVYWTVVTNRNTDGNSQIGNNSTAHFYFLDNEIADLNLDRIQIFHTTDLPPTETSCWTALTGEADFSKNRFVIERDHNPGELASDIIGTYTIMWEDSTFDLGQHIPPPCVFESSLTLAATGPELISDGTSNAFWHSDTLRLYASAPGELTINWLEEGTLNVVSTQTITIEWPLEDSQYQFYISDSTTIDLTKSASGSPDYQAARLLFTESSTAIDMNMVESERKFRDLGTGRSLLMLSEGAAPEQSPIFFVRVKTIAWDDPNYLTEEVATIGAEIIPPTNHDPFCGSPWVFFEKAFYNAGPDYYQRTEEARAAGTGPIIPVNERLPLPGDIRDLATVYYQQSPAVLTGELPQQFQSDSSMCWGYQVIRYDTQWPTAPPQIVIAEQNGTGPLNGLGNPNVYVQNDPEAAGFNPNEEHALLLADTVFALRDDFNDSETTSKPYVLVDYQDPNDLDKPKMAVWQIVAEDTSDTFQYTGVAGTLLQAPAPLNTLFDTSGACVNTLSKEELNDGDIADGSYPAKGNVFLDKNNDFWAAAAGDDGGASEVVMRYWYPVRSDYFFPNLPDPDFFTGEVEYSYINESGTLAEGTCVPWLDKRTNALERPDGRPAQQDGTPVDIRATVTWPDNLPELRLGETLITAKAGLPGITGFISAQIAYQQSVANGNAKSAVLVEPIREVGIHLEALPDDLDVDDQIVRIILNDLPPQLQPRLFYDPNAKELKFKGIFIEPALGESFILPNFLTDSEFDFLTNDFSTETNWVNAVNKLPRPGDAFAIRLFAKSGSSPAIDDANVCGSLSFDDTDDIVTIDGSQRVFIDGATEIFDSDNGDASIASYSDLKDGAYTHACAVLSTSYLVGDPGSQTKALSSPGSAEGFVTLVFENDSATGNLPVQMQIIEVSCPLFQGALFTIEPDCIFDEKLTIRHTADLGARNDDYIYEWRTLPDSDGTPPDALPENWTIFDPNPNANDEDTNTPGKQLSGQTDITIGGPGIFTLSDNWFIARYKKKTVNPSDPDCAKDYSAWTEPQFAPGWIKRVFGAINPFRQRISDGSLADTEDRFHRFREIEINTVVDMLTQAGPRWRGDVALNCATINDERGPGLIEIYETVYRRARELSIDTSPPINYAPANTSLLFAANRIANLYMLLANEAFADASDPTIALTTDGPFQAATSSIHAFMNQTSNLLEEELSLLRGRDDSRAPNIELHPVYNRLVWNFTTDFSGGEVAYALNYNIKDATGNVDGEISEEDAAVRYPQGHGDAWGHYLLATKTYYQLLRHPDYVWEPRAEAVQVAGQGVTVDFFDERRFALAAAAKARTGSAIVNLTYRDNYSENPEDQWRGYKDNDSDRAWGLAEWGSRSGQASYLDWLVGNAIIPAVDANGEGIQKVDRTTVLELREIAAIGSEIQNEVDKADSGLNPLGLAKNVVPFDIDPNLATGTVGLLVDPHFEQIYDRALAALKNAVLAFDLANSATQELRAQADAVADFQDMVIERERDFNNRLVEIFGRPYPEDVGAGKIYPGGYEGPDLWHYMYVERAALLGDDQASLNSDNFVERKIKYQDITVNLTTGDVVDNGEIEIPFTINVDQFRYEKPASYTQRPAPGEIQIAMSDVIQAKGALNLALQAYDNLILDIEHQLKTLDRRKQLKTDKLITLGIVRGIQTALNVAIVAAKSTQLASERASKLTSDLSEAAIDGIPKSLIAGLANGGDLTSQVRTALGINQALTATSFDIAASASEISGLIAEQGKELAESGADIAIETLEQDFELFNLKVELEQLLHEERAKRIELNNLAEALLQANARQQAALAKGLMLIEDRSRFRRQAASDINEYRYKDMGFRIFRNDLVQKYRAQFDQAATYAYLAATVYDFETCLLEGDARGPGQDFMNAIIKARSVGVVQDGVPQTAGISGDPGLADTLARMDANWLVLKGQLGFNNPQTETNRFSLRRELFRIRPFDENDPNNQFDAAWIQRLKSQKVSNIFSLPEFNRFAIPFVENTPGPDENKDKVAIVIPFESTVTFGRNFFNKEIAGGDSVYDTTKFATKIRSVGIWFEGYEGLGLLQTPRVYLIPAGSDTFRSPSGNGQTLRSFKILDQQIPVPFELSATGFNKEEFIPNFPTSPDNGFGLQGEIGSIRRFGQLRAFHDGGFDLEQTAQDTRLIGRSVWNTRWLLVIPVGPHPGTGDEAFDIFTGTVDFNGDVVQRGITDILIFFQTYAYSGN